MASYNYAQYIKEAIDSVINQSYQNWELIVVDDGSIDNSVEIIKSYGEKDNRIKLVQHQNGENRGLKEALLLGLKHATGEWVAFLESDDILYPQNLSKKAEIVDKYPSAKLIFNKVEFFGDEKRIKIEKKILGATQKKLSTMSFPKNMFKKFYLKNMILTFSCVMVQKKALMNTDFNTPVDAMLDWWLWTHLAYKNDFYYIDEELTRWRLHEKSYIKSAKKPKLNLVQIKAYNDIYKKSGRKFELLLFIIFSVIKLLFYKMIIRPIQKIKIFIIKRTK